MQTKYRRENAFILSTLSYLNELSIFRLKPKELFCSEIDLRCCLFCRGVGAHEVARCDMVTREVNKDGKNVEGDTALSLTSRV